MHWPGYLCRCLSGGYLRDPFCEETKASGMCPEPTYAPKAKRSYPVNIDDCTECEICIEKCPEQAIRLIPKD
jgi:NAD-dependent dihydropyrimidine dehydrogenase PreA subunit